MEWDTAAAYEMVKVLGKNVYRVDNGQELENHKEISLVSILLSDNGIVS